MAVSQAGLGLTTNVIVAAVMLFASGAAWALFNMTAVTTRQRQVPDPLLGRITSLNGTVAGGAEALGTRRRCSCRRWRDTRPDAHRRPADHCDSNPAISNRLLLGR